MKRLVRLLFMLPVVASAGCQRQFVAGPQRTVGGDFSSRREALRAYANVSPRMTIFDNGVQRSLDSPTTSTGADPAACSPERSVEDKPDYRLVVASNPADPMARYHLGRSYLDQGLLPEATSELDMAASLDPAFVEAYFLLGRALRLRGQLDLAIAKLGIAARLNPNSAAIYVERGICWDQRGFNVRAREQYLIALKLTPEDAEIYNDLGYSYYLEGDLGAAIKHYKKALALDPESVRVNNNLAMAYAQKHDYKKCLEHFRRVQGDAAAYNNVGYLLSQEGKYAEAISYYGRALESDPRAHRALINMEAALRATDHIEEAERIHLRLLQAQSVDVVRARVVPTGSGRAEGFGENSEAALMPWPASSNVGGESLDVRLLRAKRVDSEVTPVVPAASGPAGRVAPDDSEIHDKLGYACYLKGDVAGAIKHFKKALTSNPDSVQTHDHLAMTYALSRDYQKSLEHFRRAHGDAMAYCSIGYLLAKEGNYQEATGYYWRALDADPQSARVLINLESALRATHHMEEAEGIHLRFLQAQSVDVGPTPMVPAKPRGAGDSKGGDSR